MTTAIRKINITQFLDKQYNTKVRWVGQGSPDSPYSIHWDSMNTCTALDAFIKTEEKRGILYDLTMIRFRIRKDTMWIWTELQHGRPIMAT